MLSQAFNRIYVDLIMLLSLFRTNPTERLTMNKICEDFGTVKSEKVDIVAHIRRIRQYSNTT